MALAELMVVPVAGSQMKSVVDCAIQTIKQSGIKYEVGALATTLEGTLDEILDAARNAHRAALAQTADGHAFGPA